MDRHAASQAYAQYYAVGSGSDDEDRDGWKPVGRKSEEQERGRAVGRAGYDVGASPYLHRALSHSRRLTGEMRAYI